MKITKTNVYRLQIEKECGCTAMREYEDGRYQKSSTSGTTVLCAKHLSKSEDAQEILQEFLVDTLVREAELAGKQYAPFRPEVEEGDTGGVTATGESVQAMGITNLPKRTLDTTRKGPRKHPLSVTQVSVDRTDQRLPARPAAGTGDLNVAGAEDDITMTGDIETVAEDPRLTGFVVDGLGELDDVLDQQDMKSSGVPGSALSQAKD